MTLANLFYGSDLPERSSPTSMRLVCIQRATYMLRRLQDEEGRMGAISDRLVAALGTLDRGKYAANLR